MLQQVEYAISLIDLRAMAVYGRLAETLGQMVAFYNQGELSQHVQLQLIEEDESGELAPAPTSSVALFTCTTIHTFPNRFFRVITPANRDGTASRAALGPHVPEWARSSRIQVAINPGVSLDRVDKTLRRPCLDIACRHLHRDLGGVSQPKKKRVPYSSGHRAQRDRPYFFELC
ncbi:MAG: hypothetical protein AB202_01120 [Parcubacteria bacterium C7867-007]|nr:MAG: hypothetical protein AB202_01120 [Parcubacteria bacterium C7867-007]